MGNLIPVPNDRRFTDPLNDRRDFGGDGLLEKACNCHRKVEAVAPLSGAAGGRPPQISTDRKPHFLIK
jgi:hypothetical protein